MAVRQRTLLASPGKSLMNKKNFLLFVVCFYLFLFRVLLANDDYLHFWTSRRWRANAIVDIAASVATDRTALQKRSSPGNATFQNTSRNIDVASERAQHTTPPSPTTSRSPERQRVEWLNSPVPSSAVHSAHDYFADLLARHADMQTQMRTGKRPLKAIIGKCVRNNACGGFGDRLFGILTLFAAALVTDRAFFIEHSKPLPQVDYLLPKSLDWRISTVENSSVKQSLEDCFSQKSCRYQTVFLDGYILPAIACLRVFPIINVSSPILLMNANLRTGCVLKIFTVCGILPKPDTPGWDKTNETHMRIWASYVSHLMLKHLFQFAPSIVEKGSRLLREAGLPPDFENEETENCLLCVHVRSGTTSFENSHRYDNMAAFGQCAHTVEQEMAKSCPRKVTWLVVSDRQNASQLVGGNYARPLSTDKLGALIHMDKVGNGEHNRQGMKRLFVDFFLVTRCKYLVASLSTFSETASMWRGLSVRRYDMEQNNVCSKTAQNIHNWQRDVNIRVHKK